MQLCKKSKEVRERGNARFFPAVIKCNFTLILQRAVCDWIEMQVVSQVHSSF